ncbi:hypothetical protein NC652_018127 [Populus alba x Populus x berolinensis]|uniref:Uncharacterized protein n=1 Tax=Populus alba x Populus x berolinensis TaxID=444605 RepID=A0AAD6QSD7_9ROSI|nr:hypothetical protein NC652_018127 [Populus alba x Populus x berolinensis]KAJ6995345.1 hypothetical protein NC653_017966 [Populus alba x Populus x berolinensis]
MAPGSKEGAKRTERRRNLEKVGPSKGDRHQLKHKTMDIDVVMWVAQCYPFLSSRHHIYQWMQSRRKPMTDDSEDDWLVERVGIIA